MANDEVAGLLRQYEVVIGSRMNIKIKDERYEITNVKYDDTRRQDRDETPQCELEDPCYGWNWLGLMVSRRKAFIIFGRSEQSDVRIMTKNVSQQHMILYINNTRAWMAKDLSSNGTFVNHEGIASAKAQSNLARRTTSSGEILEEVALDPTEINSIRIDTTEIKVFVNDPFSNCDFDIYQCYGNLQPTLSDVTQTSIATVKSSGLSWGCTTTHHMLQIQPTEFESKKSGEKYRKLLVMDKRTGIRAVARLPDEKEMFALRERWLLFDDIGVGQCPYIFLNYPIGQGDDPPKSLFPSQFHPLAEPLNVESLPQMDVEKVLFDMMSALKWIHEKSIMHRDIKPEAIYLTPYGETKLTGFSEYIYGSSATEVVGNTEYRAPEMNNQSYNSKVDVFSLCSVLWNGLQIESDNIRPGLKNFLLIGLSALPSERPSSSEFMEALELNFSGAVGSRFPAYSYSKKIRLDCSIGSRGDIRIDRLDLNTFIREHNGLPTNTQVVGDLCDKQAYTSREAQKIIERNGIENVCICEPGHRIPSADFKRVGSHDYTVNLEYEKLGQCHVWENMAYFNVSDILLNASADARVRCQAEVQLQDAYDIRGHRQGIYVDETTFDLVCNIIMADTDGFQFTKRNTSPLQRSGRPLKETLDKYIIIHADNLRIPQMFCIDRKELTIDFKDFAGLRHPIFDAVDDRKLHLAEVIEICSRYDLERTAGVLRELLTSGKKRDWTEFNIHVAEENVSAPDDPEDDDTEIASTCASGLGEQVVLNRQKRMRSSESGSKHDRDTILRWVMGTSVKSERSASRNQEKA